MFSFPEPEPTNSPWELNTIKEAFVQVNENEEKDIFEELMRKSLRLGLLEALEKELDSLCGKKHPLTNKALITELEGRRLFMQRDGSAAIAKAVWTHKP